MFSFAKPHYKWTEPRAFRKAIRKAKKRSPIVAVIPFLIYFGLSMLLWITLIREESVRDFGMLKALSLSACLAVLLTLGLHHLNYLLPSKVTLAKLAILRQKGNRNEVWRYDQLERCDLIGLDTEDEYVRLELFGSEEKAVTTIGIGKDEDLESICQTLAAKGLNVSIDGEEIAEKARR